MLLLLEHLGELASGLEESQLTLLAGKIGVEEGNPFVTLVEPGIFDIAKVGPPLIEFCLD